MLLAGRAFAKSLFTCLLLLAVPAARTAHALPQFTAPFREWPSGDENHSIAVADLDRDGLLDVVLAESVPTFDLVFLRQNPNHTFTEVNRLSPPDPMDQLCIGDFDGNGDLDVAGIGGGGNFIYVYYGDGAFGSAGFITRPAPGGSIFLEKANLNGGSDDLVALSYYNWTVQTYTGVGGPVTPATTYSTVAYPAAIGIGDVDEDGYDDIVLPSEYTHGTQILYSDGNGGVASSQILGSAPLYGSSACVLDVDGEGHPDVVVGSADGTGVRIYLQHSYGVFDDPILAGGAPAAAYFRVLAGDINSDGAPDLVALGPTARVLRNVGSGAFTVPNVALPPGVHSYMSGALADFDQDGELDLLLHGAYGSGLVTARGNGDFTFETDTRIPVEACNGAVFLDRDNDGDEDLVTIEDNSGAMRFYDRTGQTLTLLDTQAPGGPLGLVKGDFNADGWVDVATILSWTGDVMVFLNDGTGQYPFTGYILLTTSEYPTSITAGDLDGDGRDDLVIGCTGGVETRPSRSASRPGGWPYNHGAMVFFASSTGFQPSQFVAAPGACPSDVKIGDFDGDGRRDIAVSMQCDQSVWLVPCTGPATLGTPVVQSTGFPVSGLALADLDADTRLDVLALSPQGQMGVLPNLGSWAFGPLATYSTPQQTNRAVTGDFDQDGFLDVAGLSSSGLVVVYAGAGGGALGSRADMGTAGAASQVLANDYDHDNDLDLLVCAPGQESFQLHRNLLFATLGTGATPPPARPFALGVPSPNPASGPVQVSLAIASALPVTAEVLDVSGRHVRTLQSSQVFAAGTHTLSWDLRSSAGGRVANGVYFLHVRAPGHESTRKLLVTH